MADDNEMMLKKGAGRAICYALILVFMLILSGAVIVLVVMYVGVVERAEDRKHADGEIDRRHLNSAEAEAEALHYLREGLNPDVDPCDDFYEFACGRWNLHNDVGTPMRRSYDTLTKVADVVTNKMLVSLQKLHDRAANESAKISMPEAGALSKTLRIFQSCAQMESEFHGERDFYKNPLLAMLEYSRIGMWPVMEYYWNTKDDTGNRLSSEALIGVLAGQYGVPSVITPKIDVDWRHPERRSLYIDGPELVLPTEDLYLNASLGQTILSQYRQTILTAARELAKEQYGMLPITAGTEIRDIVTFEVQLAMLIRNATRPQGPQTIQSRYNRYTLSELRNQFPGFNWNDFLVHFLPADVAKQMDYVIINHPEYVQRLAGLLRAAPVKTVYNWLIWKFVYHRLWALSPRYRDMRRALEEAVDVNYRDSRQAIRCVRLLEATNGYALGRIFLDGGKENFDRRNKPIVREMLTDIVQAFRSSLSDSDSGNSSSSRRSWMDAATRKRARAKLDAVVAHAAYPDWILNDTALDERYANLTMPKGDNDPFFFTVYNRLMSWYGNDSAYSLLRPVDRSAYFGGSPVLTNAWYSPLYNSITFPMGLLQSPVLRLDYPPAVRFGGLGSVLGHELSHGFDDTGVNFDGNGTLDRWISAESAKNFHTQNQCYVNEYSRFCYPELRMCVNGRQTLGENIADNQGLRIAYEAYRRHHSSHVPSTHYLRTLGNFTETQTFFLSYARLWCGESDAASLRQQLLFDVHPPNKPRVIGTLKNMPEFAAAFKCSTKSRSSSNSRKMTGSPRCPP